MRILNPFTTALLAATFVAGCTAANPDDIEQPDDADGKTDVVRPAGSYANESPKIGEVAFLTLNADKTFSRTIQVVDCLPRGAHCGDDAGTYRFTKSGSHRYIRFHSDGNSTRLEYKLNGNKLQLSDVDAGSLAHFYTLEAVQTWANEGEVCAGGFAGIQRECAPGLVCTPPAASCCDLASTCQKPLSKEGEPCGDDVAIQRQCEPGLTCVFPTTGPISEHTPGTCQANHPIDCAPAQCGFAPNITKLCDDGSNATLSCQPSNGTCQWTLVCPS